MTDNVNVVVTTNDNSEKPNYNYELLFQKDNTSIFGDNLPTSILQIEAESTSDVTSETVEQGGFASFYKTKKPKNINFDIAFNTDDDKQQSILDTSSRERSTARGSRTRCTMRRWSAGSLSSG